MIVDCHTHLNNYHEESSVPLKDGLDRLLAAMEKNRVDYSLVLTSYKVSEHRPATRDVVRAVRDIKNLGVVAGISYLDYKERDLRETAEYLQEGLVKGLKLYPGYEPFYPWDKRCQVIYELCVEYDVPVMIHSGDTFTPHGKLKFAHPLQIDEVAVDHPELRIVICHLGNPWLRDCMEVVYKNRNVYADISGLVLGDFDSKFENWMREQIEEVILYAGEPRYLLYGTDWPLASMESYLDFIRSLDMPVPTKDMILSDNAIRLFKLPVAPVPAGEPAPGGGPGAAARRR
jgi:predicted TIM-barrel fold metal-dependent hydrolase